MSVSTDSTPVNGIGDIRRIPDQWDAFAALFAYQYHLDCSLGALGARSRPDAGNFIPSLPEVWGLRGLQFGISAVRTIFGR